MLHIHPHAVQRPTHSRLHVRDMNDAHVVLEAVRMHKLQPVTRRLNEVERMSYIRSGSVFVWEESDDDTGLRRWTDGLLWSASRMREPFLFYETRTVNPRYPSSNLPGLVKQTYSAIVSLPPSDVPPGMAPIRKWHLTAYFEHDDLPSLLTVDTDQELCNITVPPGIFRSGKSRTRQQPSSQESNGGLRWINVDGSTGLVTSSTTSGTGRQSLDISPDMSKAPSPSHSPIFHSSSHTSPRGSTPFTQHSSSRSSSSGSWNSSASQKLPESSREHPITDPRNAHAAYQYHTLQHHHSNSTTPQPLPSASLPPLTVGFASTVLSERPPHARRTSGRIDGVRTTEDMRVIDLLNARTSLS